jgi:hypothetical protein
MRRQSAKLQRNGLRRLARGRGLELRESSYGFSLVDGYKNRVDGRNDLTLDEIKGYLTEQPEGAEQTRSRRTRKLYQAMTDTDAVQTDTVIIRAPGGAEIKWRTQRMLSLGAGAELAADIANSNVDVHDIERLLGAGCPLELAWTITQPVDTRPTAVDITQKPASRSGSN